MTRLSIVVAADKHNVIGLGNKIPWRLRADLVRLKELTAGGIVIIGRTSYESMVWYYDQSGKAMPAKTYIIVTRNPDYVPARTGTKVAQSVEEAFRLAYAEAETDDIDIFVIGGASIYKETIPLADRVYLTAVDAEVEGDTYFPVLDNAEWQESSREHRIKDDKNDFDFDFVVLDRA